MSIEYDGDELFGELLDVLSEIVLDEDVLEVDEEFEYELPPEVLRSLVFDGEEVEVSDAVQECEAEVLLEEEPSGDL